LSLNIIAHLGAFFIMANFNNFRKTTINQIRLWAWVAAVLPISALAGIFFVWKFFDGTIFGWALTIGEISMFMIAVTWWWWAMYTMRNLVKQWDETRDAVKDVLTDVKHMKSIVLDVLKKDEEDK
jgi:ABC-type multidrug transport system fused ATPase/permease subunit